MAIRAYAARSEVGGYKVMMPEGEGHLYRIIATTNRKRDAERIARKIEQGVLPGDAVEQVTGDSPYFQGR